MAIAIDWWRVGFGARGRWCRCRRLWWKRCAGVVAALRAEMSLSVRECAHGYALIALDVRRGKLRGATFAIVVFAPEVRFRARFAPEARANLKPDAIVLCFSGTNRQAFATQLEQLRKVCDALVDG